MKKTLLAILIVTSLATACAVVPADRYGGLPGVVIAPILPRLVIFDDEPYYFQNGFHYHYLNDQWYYARSRRGPWALLPRDRYPHEVRFKHHDRDRDDRNDHDHHHDHRDRDDWNRR